MKKVKFLFFIGIVILCFSLVSSVRLPVSGGDDGTWGTVLNNYLSRALGNNATILNITSGTGQPLFLVDSIGNIGIGTNTPEIVNGNNLSGTANSLNFNSSGPLSVAYSSTNPVQFFIDSNSQPNERVVRLDFDNSLFSIKRNDDDLGNNRFLLSMNTSTGRVGINNSEPKNTLHVIGDFNVTNTTGDVSLYATNSGSLGVGTSSPETLDGISLASNGYNLLNINSTVVAGIGVEGPLGALFFIENDAPVGSRTFEIVNDNNLTQFIGLGSDLSPKNGFITLDRLSGNVVVGSNPGAFDNKFEVFGNISFNDSVYIKETGYVGIGDSTPDGLLDIGGSHINASQTAWSAESSINFKENIREVEVDQELLDKIENLRIVKFNYKKEHLINTRFNDPNNVDLELLEKMNKEQYTGLIAEEFNPVFLGKDSSTINYEDVRWVMLQSIQELSRKVRELEEKNLVISSNITNEESSEKIEKKSVNVTVDIINSEIGTVEVENETKCVKLENGVLVSKKGECGESEEIVEEKLDDSNDETLEEVEATQESNGINEDSENLDESVLEETENDLEDNQEELVPTGLTGNAVRVFNNNFNPLKEFYGNLAKKFIGNKDEINYGDEFDTAAIKEIQELKLENEIMKAELCLSDLSYSWCK